MPTPIINLQDSFTGTETVTWTISDGPPNVPYVYEFTDAAGVYSSGAGDLDGSGAATVVTELGPPETPGTNFQLSVAIFEPGELINNLSDSIFYINPTPPSEPPPLLTYTTTSTGSTIQAFSYNDIQTKVNEIIGLGQDGWGQGSQNSAAVSTRNRVSANQWANLINDVNFVQRHFTGSTSSLAAPTAGITTIGPNLGNTLGTGVFNNLLPLRYTCHPSQFYGYPGETVNTLNGTSTRTTVWGREISQTVRVDWPTNLFARYFFNAGSVLTWRPIYNSIADANDRDEEWANFIDHLKGSTGTGYAYTLTNFLATSATTSTTYNSGTLSVTILASRNGTTSTATRVVMTATFRNNDLPYLVVDPVRGYWNYGPWESP
jgi:hypothetical protein